MKHHAYLIAELEFVREPVFFSYPRVRRLLMTGDKNPTLAFGSISAILLEVEGDTFQAAFDKLDKLVQSDIEGIAPNLSKMVTGSRGEDYIRTGKFRVFLEIQRVAPVGSRWVKYVNIPGETRKVYLDAFEVTGYDILELKIMLRNRNLKREYSSADYADFINSYIRADHTSLPIRDLLIEEVSKFSKLYNDQGNVFYQRQMDIINLALEKGP